MTGYHLAQINVGTLKAPLDAPPPAALYPVPSRRGYVRVTRARARARALTCARSPTRTRARTHARMHARARMHAGT